MAKAYTQEDLRAGASVPALKYDSGLGIIAILFIALLVAFALYMPSPPGAVAANAAATEFSSGRAMKQLEVISRRPHPIGSAEHAAVRDYILGELNALGLQPQVQEASVVSLRSSASVRAATVRNVVVRLAGSGGGRKALLLAAHYDTVANSHGASDDGAGVAALLETLRALKFGPALSNDVIFLFTDGEEPGLLGARGFVEEHPWAKDVGVVLNFEARGAGGPAMMFETSNENGWLVREFARAAPHPAANSMAYEIYRLLPNDTDLSVFKGAKLAGLNFAYIDGFTRYHTQTDNLANLDERSLQHHGSYALALARHFGNLSLEQPRESNAVYFDVLGKALVHYPASWVWPLTALACLLFAAALVYGFKRGALTLKGVAAGFFAFIVNLVVATGLVTLIWWLDYTVQSWFGRGIQDDLYRSKLYFVGFVFVAVAVTATTYTLLRRRVGVGNLTAGALLCWLVLLVAASAVVPGGSYLLLWPLLFSLVALALLFKAKGEESRPPARFAALVLSAVPAIILLVPMIYQAFVATGLAQIIFTTAAVALLCGLLAPHVAALVGARRRWLLPGAAAALGVILIASAAFNTGFSQNYPKADHVFYVMNSETGKAAWASSDAAADEWTSQFFPQGSTKGSVSEYVPLTYSGYLKNPAPSTEHTPADIRVVSDTTADGVRKLQVRVASTQEGINITVPGDANVQVVAAAVNGKRVENSGAGAPGAWGLQYWAPPAGGFDLTLEMKGAQAVPLKVVEQSYGLPELPGVALTPRPGHIMPSTLPNSDMSLFGKTYTF